MTEAWRTFTGTHWKRDINVRDFIQNNYTPYSGGSDFLAGPTEATQKLWGRLSELQKEERAKGGVLDMETEIVSSITAYPAAYIDPALKDLEKVVGLLFIGKIGAQKLPLHRQPCGGQGADA